MEKKISSLGIVALLLNIPVFLLNLVVFIPMLVEQINYGKGTQIEMGALWIMIVSFMSFIPLVLIIILTSLSVGKDSKTRIIINYCLAGLTIVMIFLTYLFMYI